MADGDVPGDGEAPNAAGGDGEEAVWLDLVARFGAPASQDGEAPWPEREDLAGPVHVTPAQPPIVPEALPREPPVNPGGLPPMPGQPRRFGGGFGRADTREPEDPAEDHYVPPPPPPLPKLDSVTKFAWLGLFGGPLYLLAATALSWQVSGLAAFLAVAAFVGGFVLLVMRMDNGGPRDSGPDDGAVV